MAILHIKDKDGNFVRISSTPGKSAYEIAVEKGLFVGTEQEFAEMQVFQNKEILDQITQENIDRWNSGVGGGDIDLSNYVTETELEEKGYLTEHQDISHKADRTELHNHSNKTVLDTITEQIVSEWNNKSEFSGDYDDLTNKPNIPSIEGLASEDYVNTYVGEAIKDIPKEEVDLSEYALKTDIPTVPTKLSELTNDSNFISSIPSEYITETELEEKGYLNEHQDISHLATKEELPTRTSELTNDSNFANERYVNDAISSLEKIQLSDTTPTNTDVAIWINTSEDIANNPLAKVSDNIVSNEHTWSSEKINNLFNSLKLVKEGSIVKLMLGNIELSNISIE
jgi:hypothetical protein